MFETGCKLLFSLFSEELPNVAMCPTLPLDCKAGCQKKICLICRILDFHHFKIFYYVLYA
jgi:hypothetical protein